VTCGSRNRGLHRGRASSAACKRVGNRQAERVDRVRLADDLNLLDVLETSALSREPFTVICSAKQSISPQLSLLSLITRCGISKHPRLQDGRSSRWLALATSRHFAAPPLFFRRNRVDPVSSLYRAAFGDLQIEWDPLHEHLYVDKPLNVTLRSPEPACHRTEMLNFLLT
jgi:hypothetical protein